jgi:GNAT superfamily N-acetyltransferase
MIKYRVGHRKDGCKTISAYDGKNKIGWIGACQSLRYLEVQKVHVVETHRRQKIATALYEHAARLACEIGKPLASYSWQRNETSDAFWQKQRRLGRAVEEPNERNLSVISCPVSSLAGPRWRRRKP